MLGISRTKGIDSPYRNSLRRSRNVSKTSSTDAIQSADKSSADMSQFSPSQMYDTDLLYEDLDDLKDAYQQFNHDEHELEERLMHFLDHMDELLKEINALIQAYNRAIVSLHQFDHAFSTDYVSLIGALLMRYQYRLKQIGITSTPDYQLELNPLEFLDQIENDRKAFAFLFGQRSGVFIQIFKIFHDIKLPKKNPDKNPFLEQAGSIIDWRG